MLLRSQALSVFPSGILIMVASVLTVVCSVSRVWLLLFQTFHSQSNAGSRKQKLFLFKSVSFIWEKVCLRSPSEISSYISLEVLVHKPENFFGSWG